MFYTASCFIERMTNLQIYCATQTSQCVLKIVGHPTAITTKMTDARFLIYIYIYIYLDAGFESNMVDLYVTLNTMLLKIVQRLTQFVH